MKSITVGYSFLFLLFEVVSSFDLRLRADPIDPCLDRAPTSDGPTSDRSAGIGVEFEAPLVKFKSDGCNAADTNQAKGQQVGDRRGDVWQLTADTTDEMAGSLTAEYILNGKEIRIGSGVASAAAAKTAWDPYQSMPNNEWDIEGNKCNPWAVDSPGATGGALNVIWAVQITAPLPLEAISDLFMKAVGPIPNSPLLATYRPGGGMVSITPDFFQSSPNGIAPDSVKADVFGFLSLVVSYVKKATPTDPPKYETRSPKFTMSIMPRTDFVAMYAQVKAALPGTGSLYDLVKILSCYKNYEDYVEIDPIFCDGSEEEPEPKDYIDVPDWIESIENGPSPDKFTELDRLVDGQIGGLGEALENVIDTNRAVPLFEFRNLRGLMPPGFENFVTEAEQALIDYHNKHKSPPQERKLIKRVTQWLHQKRQTDIYGCSITPAPSVATASATTASTLSCSYQGAQPGQGIFVGGCVCGSTTLPLITLESVSDFRQSCSYTALPTASVPNARSTASTTWSDNCEICTLVGGIADSPSCTSVEGCTKTQATPTPDASAPEEESPPPEEETEREPVCEEGDYGADATCDGKCNGENADCQCAKGGTVLDLEPVCTCTCGD
ncbi:MAG: hypothetical protein Q9183_002498 [Haloplaca sp. 2 TL-2023]